MKDPRPHPWDTEVKSGGLWWAKNRDKYVFSNPSEPHKASHLGHWGLWFLINHLAWVEMVSFYVTFCHFGGKSAPLKYQKPYPDPHFQWHLQTRHPVLHTDTAIVRQIQWKLNYCIILREYHLVVSLNTQGSHTVTCNLNPMHSVTVINQKATDTNELPPGPADSHIWRKS